MKKRLCLTIALAYICSLVPLSLPVMAENVCSEIAYYEHQNDTFAPSVNPRFPSENKEINILSAEYSNEQKALILRDFLLERLNNLEEYQDELSFGEYQRNDTLYFDLSKLYDFELYYDTESNINATKEIFRNAINDIIDKYPRMFWCQCSWTWSYNKTGKVTRLGILLNCNTDFKVADGLQPVIDKVNSLTDEFDSYVRAIVGLIPDSYSDYEKILFTNDYLCTNYKYDVNYSIYNAYDFFKNEKGVCQAYTLAFMAIMDALGIRCDSVSSEEMNHIWNLVELDEKWYHIDVTWNDPCLDVYDTDTLGYARHKYFLLSTERIENIDTYPKNHYGFDIDSYGYEIGTEFDEIEVDLNQSLKSSFIELNGTWYNTGYNSNARTCGIYGFDSPVISSIKNEDLKEPIYNVGLWTTSDNRYYQGSYSYLSKYNNAILFNTPTSIYMFDGKNFKELYVPEKDNNKRIYGFVVKDDTMYMQLATSPNISDIWYGVTESINIYDLLENNLTIMNYDRAYKCATIYASEDVAGTLVFASYDINKNLIDCKFVVCSGENKIIKGTNKYNAPESFNVDGACTVKIMLLKNMSTLKPLCMTYEK